MEKYIKADTILKFINGCLEHEDKITDTEKAVLTGVKACVERIPAADVVEVIHAYWIDENPQDLLDVRMRCSNCRTIHAPYAYWHYCPNCGAKMDGGQDDG